MWRLLLCILFAFPALLPADDVPPDSAAQDRILAAIRTYADQYIGNLPNFLCDQTTHQFEAGLKSQKWHKGDTLVSVLRFYDGKEQRNLRLVNEKPPEQARKRWRTPLRSEGEFGILLAEVAGTDSPAFYQWNRWETVNGKRVAVFNFSVDKEHSALRLSLSDLAHAVVPYGGAIYADPLTGVVWRIVSEITDIPPALLTRSSTTAVEYGRVGIGGKSYMLPVEASVLVVTHDQKIRNELVFQNYRKFEASSSITFGDADAPKQ